MKSFSEFESSEIWVKHQNLSSFFSIAYETFVQSTNVGTKAPKFWETYMNERRIFFLRLTRSKFAVWLHENGLSKISHIGDSESEMR